MYRTQLRDVHDMASDLHQLLDHLGRLLDDLAAQAPEPINHQLAICAAASRLGTDTAIMIEDIAR